MNLAFAIRTLRWMVRDTFRQSVATKLFWAMLAITFVCTLFCLSMTVTGDTPSSGKDYDAGGFITPAQAKELGEEKVKKEKLKVVSGEVSFGFGLMTVPIARYKDDAVRYVQIWLAAILADTAGVLLALLWTAGFLPTFLEPQSSTVLLAKPAPRWAILLGKYLGVVLFVAVQATIFVGATWLALGFKTGVWNGTYWLAVPLLVLNFGIFYSVSAFLAVVSRSTVVCIFGTLLFWLLCWTVNYTHLRLLAQPVEGLGAMSGVLLDAIYWILPKPLDLGGIFYDSMRATGFAAPVPELDAVQKKGLFRPELSALASALFAPVVLFFAAFEFKSTDY
ncbi:MAG: ABC transporter permease subunit [Planctomycetia bacterium]|nr:ABC transporter permease subunit [Planctomycetia bacterium]